jgi:hypothetical protein
MTANFRSGLPTDRQLVEQDTEDGLYWSPDTRAETRSTWVPLASGTHGVASVTVRSTAAHVSVIDGATCNAERHSGCNQTPPTMPTGRFVLRGVAMDEADHTLFVGSIADSDIDVFDTATCSAHVHRGCGQQPHTVNTGGWPSNVAFDPDNSTVYAPDNVDGEVSIFSFVAPARVGRVSAVARAGTVTLAWPVAADGGLPISYRVLPAPACPACGGLQTRGVLSTTVSGLTPGQKYTLTVRATDAAGAGQRSRPSAPVTVRP